MSESAPTEDAVVDWLVSGDPSVAWQAQRDLLDRPEPTWMATRRRVAEEGWGRALLDRQDPSGTWGGGLYQPKWTSTTYTLLMLYRFGLDPEDPRARAGCRRLLEDARWLDGGVTYWASHTEAEQCVNGMVLIVASSFGADEDRLGDIAGFLLGRQLPDGGWNCRDHATVRHSSFHTTITALEGLHRWRHRTGTPAVDAAIDRGHEFLLDHRMFRSHRTGEVIDEAWTTPHFPPRWHYDVLRGLDHLRDAGATRDGRARDAIELIASSRRADGRWGKGSQYSGETFFPLEPGRVPGRWNTLRALRVLRWWEEGP